MNNKAGFLFVYKSNQKYTEKKNVNLLCWAAEEKTH